MTGAIDLGLPVFAPAAPLAPGVRCFTTQRSGAGVSTGAFAELNFGDHVDDSPSAVAANRTLLVKALAGRPVQWLQQVHGTGVWPVVQDVVVPAPTADALWTRHSSVALAIMTADCLPVVLASADGQVVGLAHAGWRGLVSGVIEALIEAMVQEMVGSRESEPVPIGTGRQGQTKSGLEVAASALKTEAAGLNVWLGPCIGATAYEVGPEVAAAVEGRLRQLGHLPLPDARKACLKPGVGRDKYLLDLSALAKLILGGFGVREISSCEVCCLTDERCYSYRRDGTTGRMATVVTRGG